MTPLLIYIIKASACMVVLFGFYKLVLEGEKTLEFNRFYLVLALVLSLVLPAINTTVYLPAFLSAPQSVEAAAATFDPVILPSTGIYEVLMTEEAAANPVNWSMILLMVYLSVATVFFLRFTSNIGRIFYMIYRSDKLTEHSIRYVLVDDTDGLPYSFLHFVFVCKSAFLEGRMPDEVLAHEKAHSLQLHTLDILIVEFIKIVFWFHPMVYYYKRAIQLNHEYLADNDVLRQCELTGYQKTLINYTFQRHSFTLVSNFNYSFTKKRLIMMTKLRTSKMRLSGKIALLLPILMGAFLISATCRTPEPPTKEEKQVVIEKKVLSEEEAAALKEAEAAKKEAVKHMVIVKEEVVKAKKDMEAAKNEMEEQKKVVKMKRIELDGDSEDLEGQLEKLMKDLEKDLEGMEIDIEQLMEQIQEGINIDVEEIVDGVTKRIKVITPGIDEEIKHRIIMDIDEEFGGDFDIDIDIEDLEEIDKLIELKHLDGANKKVIYIGEDGEHIEIKEGGKEKIIIVHGDDGEVMEMKSGGGEKIVIIKDGKKEIHEIHEGGHKEKIVIINGGEEDGEHIWIHDGDHDDMEKEIKIIIKELDDDGKSKKKNKRK